MLPKILEVAGPLGPPPPRPDDRPSGPAQPPRLRRLDLAHRHSAPPAPAPSRDGGGGALRHARLRPLDGSEHVRPERDEGGARGELELEERLPRIDRPDHGHGPALDPDVGDVLREEHAPTA